MLECRSDITNDSCEELAENISVLESNRQFKDNVGNIGDYEGEGVGQTEVEYLQSVNSMILSLTVPQPVFSTLIGRGMSRLDSRGREVHSVATPALLCHKEPARSKERPVGYLRAR